MGFDEFDEVAKKGKKDPVIVAAEELVARHSFATLRDTDEILWYHDGTYEHLGETRIREALGEGVRKGDTAEIVEIIKRKTFHDREEFDADPFMLPVNNGLLDLRTFELRPPSPLGPEQVQGATKLLL